MVVGAAIAALFAVPARRDDDEVAGGLERVEERLQRDVHLPQPNFLYIVIRLFETPERIRIQQAL